MTLIATLRRFPLTALAAAALTLAATGCGSTSAGHEAITHPTSVPTRVTTPAADEVVSLRTQLPPRPVTRREAPRRRDADPRLQVRFFAAGHGLSVLFQTPDGHAVLVDAGRGHREILGDNLVKRRLVPHFRAHGIRRLDAWFITHPHFDHFGDPEALGAVVKIDRVVLNADGELWLGPRLTRELDDAQIDVAHRGYQLTYGRLHLKVLHPEPDAAPAYRTWGVVRHNNRSQVILASYGRTRFLLVGDLYFRGERRLMRALRKTTGSTTDLRADVLQLGHHGIGSGQPSFLRAVRPRFAVASLGDTWRGHDRLPYSQAFQLARRKIRLLRTDRDGDVIFLTDGETLEVDTLPEYIHAPRRARRKQRRSRRRHRRHGLTGPFGRTTYGLEMPDGPGR